MTVCLFRNTWEFNKFTKCGELNYSSKFPNLVTHIGKRWYLASMYSNVDMSFSEEQRIRLWQTYIEPDPLHGKQIVAVGDAHVHTPFWYEAWDEGVIFEFYSGSDTFAPSEPTTTPMVTDTIQLTIDPGISTYIYNVVLDGTYYSSEEGYGYRILFSITALPLPLFWTNEEILEITYTVEVENTTPLA